MPLLSDLKNSSCLFESAVGATSTENEAFLARLTSSSKAVVPSTRPSLFVLQGECALCQGSPKFDMVGSDDATTCVVVVITGENRMVYVAHVDESSCDESLVEALTACTDHGQSRAKVYLAGGYDGSVGDSVLRNLMTSSSGLETQVSLELCCLGEINRDERGFPRTRALAVDLQSGTPYPFTFEYRGPEISRRHAQRSLATGCRLYPLVKRSGVMHLAPLKVILGYGDKFFYERLLTVAKDDPDEFLQQYSTSPLHESDMFIPDMVGMITFMLSMNGKTVPEAHYEMTGSEWRTV